MKRVRKLVSIVMTAVLLLSLASVAVGATYEGEARAVMGANLSEEDKASVYQLMGVEQGSVEELTVTNDEERAYLEGIVADSKIGTRSISCAYIKLLNKDEGLHITIRNIDWCTEEIYRNALMTAGIYDAEVVIAAPFEVSGTAALTGLYKAYEDITGDTLDDDAKQTAVDELVITSELADTVGDADATEVVNELKKILDQTASMTDDELRQEIISIADQCNVTLTDDQISQLLSLVRQLEKLDTSVLIEKVESLQNLVQGIAKTGSSISSFFESVGNFFSRIGSWFAGLFQ